MTLLRLGVLVLALLTTGCARTDFDWAQGENFLLEKHVEEKPDGSVEMRFVSLVNAPGEELYKAFIDVEHHDQFIEGVTESKLVSGVGGTKKIIDVTNQVLGRPNQAQIEWTIDREHKTVAFRTLKADFTDNAAEYQVEVSPDGKRALITTVYHLRDKGGHPFPLHSLKQGVIDGHLAALRSLKRRVSATRSRPRPKSNGQRPRRDATAVRARHFARQPCVTRSAQVKRSHILLPSRC